MFRNIWQNGYEIERDGKKITLTKEEIRDINYLLDAACGRDMAEYFRYDTFAEEYDEDCFDAEGIEYRKNAREQLDKLLNDEDKCKELYDNYCEAVFEDSYETEYDCVMEMID